MPRDWRKPLAALDQHVDLINWWRRNAYAPGMAESFQSTHPVKLPEPLDRYLGRRLDEAATIYVTSPIIDRLWAFASEHDPDDLALRVEDLFLDNGYVWFEHPLLITDVRGRICTIRALAWFREPDRLRVFYFNDKLHPLDELTQDGYAHTGLDPWESNEPRTPLFHHDVHDWGSPMFAAMREATVEDLARRVIADDLRAMIADGTNVRAGDDGAWYFTYNYEDVPADRAEAMQKMKEGWQFAIDPRSGQVSSWFKADTLLRHKEDITALHRFLLVLWQWMGDQMPAVVHPDRPVRRRLARAKVGLAPEVLVIDIRTKEGDPFYEPPGSPALVMWSHRWRSRGHWRRYRNKVTGEVVKITWVRGSVKGPDHLPLWEKDTVYNVRR